MRHIVMPKPRTPFLLAAALVPWATGVRAQTAEPYPIRLTAADGLTVYGDEYRPPGEARGVILLFHQGGSNAGAEYGPLAPRLLEAGYHLVAIDQRSGGEILGGSNRTLEAAGGDPHYCEAYRDLEAALGYGEELGLGRPIAWGSSYSAALALKLASEHGDRVAAVLAFSPAQGSSMGGCGADAFVDRVEVPVLAFRPAVEVEIPAVAEALERFREVGHATYVSDPGVHGSSMLNADRVEGSVEAAWKVVLDFLDTVAESRVGEGR